MAKEIRINVRADESMKGRLQKVCQTTGANETTLVMACVEALVDYIEKHGEITLPLVVLPKSSIKKKPNPTRRSSLNKPTAVPKHTSGSSTGKHGPGFHGNVAA